MAIKWNNGAANAAVDALKALFNSGVIRLYTGSRPANPTVAISGQTLLAELTFGSTAYGSASNGSTSANSITQDSSANATGDATWARVLQSDGSTVICDLDVSTSGADLNLVTASITSGQPVQITSFSLSFSRGW